MSGRRGRRYRLRKRLRVKRWAEIMERIGAMWAGMELIIDPPRAPLGSPDPNIRLTHIFYVDP